MPGKKARLVLHQTLCFPRNQEPRFLCALSDWRGLVLTIPPSPSAPPGLPLLSFLSRPWSCPQAELVPAPQMPCCPGEGALASAGTLQCGCHRTRPHGLTSPSAPIWGAHLAGPGSGAAAVLSHFHVWTEHRLHMQLSKTVQPPEPRGHRCSVSTWSIHGQTGADSSSC